MRVPTITILKMIWGSIWGQTCHQYDQFESKVMIFLYFVCFKNLKQIQNLEWLDLTKMLSELTIINEMRNKE